MLALCKHNILAYYAFNYAGIFDSGLMISYNFEAFHSQLLHVGCVLLIKAYKNNEIFVIKI